MTEKEFISNQTAKFTNDGLKKFPEDFIKDENYNEIKMPLKGLILGEEFFGSIEILTVDGSVFMQAENLHTAKFIVYANRTKPELLKLPLNEDEIKKANAIYENYIDSIIRAVESEYKKNFKDGKNASLAVNEIFRMLNLTRY